MQDAAAEKVQALLINGTPRQHLELGAMEALLAVTIAARRVHLSKE
jgi:hypothetical protein